MRSNLVQERAKNSLSLSHVRGIIRIFWVTPQQSRELGVASSNHSWLSSHVVSARPWFWGSTKKPFMTSTCRSCHHAARTWSCWPPGTSNQAYLSFPHLEASPTMTFSACSSPAPTPVKLQHALAILSQESVHTTLSITHHTRKRPSTGPRTTHGPQNCVRGDTQAKFRITDSLAIAMFLATKFSPHKPTQCGSQE
jgi:hypothetical protein